MQAVMDKVNSSIFMISESGALTAPQDWKANKKEKTEGMKFAINETTYQMGIGGLHSCESNRAIFSDEEYILVDRDVSSYYPFIILLLGLYPEHLGSNFLEIYRKIVYQRLEAKKTGNKKVADSLKITINGTFGKLGNKWSIMYSPRLLLQVTLTGQLSLLYLIEKIELAGIRVVSANTDGIVIKCPRRRKHELDHIVAEWEDETGFDTDENLYNALLSRSVNDYMAVQVDGKVKGKGGLGWGITELFKNPVNGVCITAIENFLSKGIPIEETIHNCTDVTQFLTVRKVTGGAVRNGVYLGKAIRWYYATDAAGCIVYAKSGNTVPKSEGAKGLQLLPDEVPHDLDYQWYVKEAYQMLHDTGYPVNLNSTE